MWYDLRGVAFKIDSAVLQEFVGAIFQWHTLRMNECMWMDIHWVHEQEATHTHMRAGVYGVPTPTAKQ